MMNRIRAFDNDANPDNAVLTPLFRLCVCTIDMNDEFSEKLDDSKDEDISDSMYAKRHLSAELKELHYGTCYKDMVEETGISCLHSLHKIRIEVRNGIYSAM